MFGSPRQGRADTAVRAGGRRSVQRHGSRREASMSRFERRARRGAERESACGTSTPCAAKHPFRPPRAARQGVAGMSRNELFGCFMSASLPHYAAFCPLLASWTRRCAKHPCRGDARILRPLPDRGKGRQGAGMRFCVATAGRLRAGLRAPETCQACSSGASAPAGEASRASTCARRARSWPRRIVRSAVEG